MDEQVKRTTQTAGYKQTNNQTNKQTRSWKCESSTRNGMRGTNKPIIDVITAIFSCEEEDSDYDMQDARFESH
jgi:hypothetical protein